MRRSHPGPCTVPAQSQLEPLRALVPSGPECTIPPAAWPPAGTSVRPLHLATSARGTYSPLRLLLFSDKNLVQPRPDPVIFRALGRKRLRKEVTEAKKKAGVEEEERGGGRGESCSAQEGAAHTRRDKPMRRKPGRGDAREGGRLQAGGRAPGASRKTDPELGLLPPFLGAAQSQGSPTPCLWPLARFPAKISLLT